MIQTGTRPEQLWDTFKEWFPSFVQHVESWVEQSNNSIAITFKDDGYITSSWTYIFGKKSDSEWLLKRQKLT